MLLYQGRWLDLNNDYELIIINKGQVYLPSIIEPVIWEDEIKGSPSKLTFTVVKGDKSNFQEGNIVRFKYKGDNIFYGYVFTKQRDKQHHIEVSQSYITELENSLVGSQRL